MSVQSITSTQIPSSTPAVSTKKRDLNSAQEGDIVECSSVKKVRSKGPLHSFIEEFTKREVSLNDHIHGKLIRSYKILLKIRSSQAKEQLHAHLNNGLTLQLKIIEDWHNRLQPFAKLFQIGRKNDDRELKFPMQLQNPINNEDPLTLASKDEYDLLKEKYKVVADRLFSLRAQINDVSRAYGLMQQGNPTNWENRVKQMINSNPSELWLISKATFSLS